MVTPPLVLYSRLIRGNPISAVLLMIRQHYARAKYDPYSFRQSVVTLHRGYQDPYHLYSSIRTTVCDKAIAASVNRATFSLQRSVHLRCKGK